MKAFFDPVIAWFHNLARYSMALTALVVGVIFFFFGSVLLPSVFGENFISFIAVFHQIGLALLAYGAYLVLLQGMNKWAGIEWSEMRTAIMSDPKAAAEYAGKRMIALAILVGLTLGGLL